MYRAFSTVALYGDGARSEQGFTNAPGAGELTDSPGAGELTDSPGAGGAPQGGEVVQQETPGAVPPKPFLPETRPPEPRSVL